MFWYPRKDTFRPWMERYSLLLGWLRMDGGGADRQDNTVFQPFTLLASDIDSYLYIAAFGKGYEPPVFVREPLR